MGTAVCSIYTPAGRLLHPLHSTALQRWTPGANTNRVMGKGRAIKQRGLSTIDLHLTHGWARSSTHTFATMSVGAGDDESRRTAYE
jgi:hypothetical protein